MNQIIVSGRITDSIQSKKVKNALLKVSFVLAVDRNTNKTSIDKQKCDFIHIEALGKLAENIINYCEKGIMVIVKGQLHIDQTEKREYTKILADYIEFL